MMIINWVHGECAECGDVMKVIASEKFGTCKQCLLISQVRRIATILEGHMGWD